VVLSRFDTGYDFDRNFISTNYAKHFFIRLSYSIRNSYYFCNIVVVLKTSIFITCSESKSFAEPLFAHIL